MNQRLHRRLALGGAKDIRNSPPADSHAWILARINGLSDSRYFGMSENLDSDLHRRLVVVAILKALILLAGAFSKLAIRAETLGSEMADQDAAALNLTK